jgi:glycosyltransferase involved in cell wall biosynthesis
VKEFRKPTICLCAKSIDIGTYSGTKRYVFELIKWLKKNKKYDLVIITSPKNSIFDKISILFIFYSIYKLTSLLVKKRIDLLHCPSFAYSYLLPYAKMFGVKTVVTVVDVPKATETRYMENSILDYIRINLYRFLMYFSDYFFAISRLNVRRLQEEMGINKRRIFLFSLGVDKKFSPMKVEKQGFVVGYLGGRIPVLNLKYALMLINAFKKFSRNHKDSFLIITGIDKFNIIPNYIKNIDDKHIKHIRFVPEEEIVKFYNSLDVFVFPSIYEGFGLPIMEAKRCGLPVLLMKKAMISEEVKKHSLFYETEEDLIEILDSLYKNKELLKEIGSKSHLYAKKFTWKKSVSAVIRGYNAILNIKKRGVH